MDINSTSPHTIQYDIWKQGGVIKAFWGSQKKLFFLISNSPSWSSCGSRQTHIHPDRHEKGGTAVSERVPNLHISKCHIGLYEEKYVLM